VVALLEIAPAKDGERNMARQTFAARLKQLREQAGLSQQELADKTGLHKFGVAKIEQGQREPSFAVVQALADALGVGVEAFADTTPTPAEQKKPRHDRPGRPKKQPPASETPPAGGGAKAKKRKGK
jgi:transcriptional regulator with XRE-family HTH domain